MRLGLVENERYVARVSLSSISWRRAEYGFGECGPNTELSEFLGPHRVRGRELSEFLSRAHA